MATERWNIDTAHSEIQFIARHMVISKVRGHFKKWSASVEVDASTHRPVAAEVAIEVGSIDTREEKRDGHLRSADFFDAENHPQITFESKRVEPKGQNGFDMIGDITIRGTTKEITIHAESTRGGKDPWGNERLILSGKASLDRREFGLRWNQALETGGVLVGDKIEIEIDAQAVKA